MNLKLQPYEKGNFDMGLPVFESNPFRSDLEINNETMCFEKCKTKAFDIKRPLVGYTYWTHVSPLEKFRYSF